MNKNNNEFKNFIEDTEKTTLEIVVHLTEFHGKDFQLKFGKDIGIDSFPYHFDIEICKECLRLQENSDNIYKNYYKTVSIDIQ